MTERLPLKNKKVFVTGSTSGIGRAIAMQCAEEGATVIHCGRRKDRVDAVSAEIKKQFGLDAFGYELDVRDRKKLLRSLRRSLQHTELLKS